MRLYLMVDGNPIDVLFFDTETQRKGEKVCRQHILEFVFFFFSQWFRVAFCMPENFAWLVYP